METIKIHGEDFVIMSKLELLKHDYAIKEKCYGEARKGFEDALQTLYKEYHWIIEDEAQSVLWILREMASSFRCRERAYGDAFSKEA